MSRGPEMLDSARRLPKAEVSTADIRAMYIAISIAVAIAVSIVFCDSWLSLWCKDTRRGGLEIKHFRSREALCTQDSSSPFVRFLYLSFALDFCSPFYTFQFGLSFIIKRRI